MPSTSPVGLMPGHSSGGAGVVLALLACPLVASPADSADPPEKVFSGKEMFICGPGDPEGFLYLGRRKPDGTRDGPQVELIRKLIRHGGNSIYMQAARSPGGDGGPSENPFVDNDPAKGIDRNILDQWDRWFTLMDTHGILIYFVFFDDGVRMWNTKDTVGPQEREFLTTMVNRFEHHKNLVWVVAEECEEAYSMRRVRAMADVVKAVDDVGHLIGAHHHSGTSFKAWRAGSALNHFSMQYNASVDAAHKGAVDAFEKARGKYQVIYSENTAIGTSPDAMRRFAWASATGGVMPMVLRMDIENTPPTLLRQCRHLQEFFEETAFLELAPHDKLAAGSAKWVLADPPSSYVAYADKAAGTIGLKGVPAGVYRVSWLDCVTGTKREQRAVRVAAGSSADFAVPPELGGEVAVWVRPR